MKITLLGTGTPTPSTRRAGSSFFVETGTDRFVFDCCPGSHGRMLEAGIAPTVVTQLFVSHWHYDHFTDLPHLLLRRWDQGVGRIPELKIYGPEPVERIVRQLFGTGGVFGPDLEARTRSDLSVAIFLALTHITEQMDVPGVRERAIHEVASIFGGNVIWGEDLLRFSPGDFKPARLL